MTGRVTVAASARLRRAGGRWVRRLGLLPGGDSDRLGEDDALADVVLPQQVMVFFPDVPTNVYQLAQWYDVLRALDARHPVVVITQDSRTTRAVRDATALPVHCVARSATLDGLVARGRLGLALYVGHHGANFSALRHPTLVHAYLGHGESDKGISASNQVKAYDFVLVAGEAAVDRLRRTVPLYDADARCLRVGRPQLDPPPARAEGDPVHVLYAPTWEGAQPSVAYSSVPTHARRLVESLLGAGMVVTYRPHPRTGANSAAVRAEDAAVRQLVRAHPSGRGSVDDGSPLRDAFAAADVLVTDVSSLAVEWLPTGRPLVVTVPAAAATVPPSPLLDLVPRLPAAEAADAARVVRRAVADDDRTARAELTEYYLGDTSPGAAMAQFLDACSSMLELRARELDRLAALW